MSYGSEEEQFGLADAAAGDFTHRALVDPVHRVYQYLTIEDGDVMDWGLDEQCGNGCNDGFELLPDNRTLICNVCNARYAVEKVRS